MEGLQEVLDDVQMELRNLDNNDKHEACVQALKRIADLWATSPPKYRREVIRIQKLLMAVRDGLE
jgi:hypothetical protein